MDENEEAEIEKKDNDDVSYLDKLENQMNNRDKDRISSENLTNSPFYDNKLYNGYHKITKSTKKDFGYAKSNFRITSQHLSESKYAYFLTY
jgi:hypothetical protein